VANAFDMSNPRRTGMDLVRWGGLAAVLAGGASAASGIVHFALLYPEAGTGPANSLSNYLIESAHAIAEAGMLGPLLGLRARQALRYGWLGKTGFIVAFLGTALLCAITVIAVITKDALGEAVLGSVFISGVLGWLVGFPPLGIATLRARVLPRWVGVLLIAYTSRSSRSCSAPMDGEASRSAFSGSRLATRSCPSTFTKLQVADRAQAIVRAREAGLGRAGERP
jgi:hypothetical protein